MVLVTWLVSVRAAEKSEEYAPLMMSNALRLSKTAEAADPEGSFKAPSAAWPAPRTPETSVTVWSKSRRLLPLPFL